MNIGKSTKIMLIKNSMTLRALAHRLNISDAAASTMVNRRHANTRRVEELAVIFDMKPSEFIALGE